MYIIIIIITKNRKQKQIHIKPPSGRGVGRTNIIQNILFLRRTSGPIDVAATNEEQVFVCNR
jgi:hypothetical protein